MMRAATSFIAFVAATTLAAFAQVPVVPPPPPVPPAAPQHVQQVPPRDAGAAPQTGTATIIGTVVTDDAMAQPIRHATVTVSGGGLRGSRQVVTDGTGRFVVPNLPAGNFSVSASKPSYVGIAFGSKGPGTPGTLIQLAAGATETAHLRMPKGAVIAGTIFDPFGRPRPQTRVALYQYRTVGGQRRITQVGTQNPITDDRGNYRLYGLQAGDFIVAAIPQQSVEVRMLTADELKWAQTSASGGLSGPVTALAPPPLAGPTIGLAPIYFPGVAEIMSATAITVTYGEERSGVDFQLQAVPTARIEGVLLDGQGRPPQQADLRLFPEDRFRSPSTAPQLNLPSDYARFEQNTGKFAFTNVPPGRYMVMGTSTTRTPGVAGAASVSNTFWAMTQVDVSGSDVSDVRLTLQSGLSISGRVAFESATPASPRPDLSRVRVNASFIDPPPIQISSVPAASVNADGTFTLRGAMPGRYRVGGSAPLVPGAGGPWILKSVIAGGIDVLDGGLDVASSDVGGILVTFTDRISEISGTLMDASGAPAKDLWVMCFSTDRTFWTVQSRRTRVIRPAPDGRFRFTPWVPGEYFLVAVTDGDKIDLTDPIALDQIAAVALRVRLAEGEKLVRDLKVAR